MTEKEIKQLIKLLIKFADAKEKDSGGNVVERDYRIRKVVLLVVDWVKWFGRDELDMD